MNHEPRGIRQNNPGNIRLNPNIHWQGEVPTTDPDFCAFDTDVDGIRALAKILYNYQTEHGLNTVQEMIDRWAPPVENDTGAYVNAVAEAMQVQPTDTIDVTDADTLDAMVTAIITHENGEQPYPDATIQQAITEVLNA
jgi:hypothetical protein